MKRLTLVAALLVTGAALSASADAAVEGQHLAEAPAAAASAEMSEGEVRKVDKVAGKITIKHGPLINLDMPPMTMVFRVKDPAILDQVRPGDRIKFLAEKIGGAYVVVQLEPEK